MAFSNEIAKYQLLYYGKRRKDTMPIANISLYATRNQYLGSVTFYRDGQKIPNNLSVETYSPKRAYLRMPESQRDGVVDMLRNEKPCKVYYSGPTNAYIHTGKEPIGEEENPTPEKKIQKQKPTIKIPITQRKTR